MDEDTLTQAEVRATTPEALKLLGNASSQISHLRRKKVLKSVNADMQDLADEEDLFKGASPNLFGPGFETKMKERAESLKLLSGSVAKPPAPKKFFLRSCPSAPQRGGGQSSRRGRTWQKKQSQK
jgi:hypothetical protein